MSILEIKKKIGGVKNTKKITKAMQLVAAAKMQQFQKKARSSRSFTMDLIQSLHSQNLAEFKCIYTHSPHTHKTLFVLYTSDKGLCGPLNSKLINTLFRSNKWNDLEPDQRLLICIGKKAADYVNSRNIPTHAQFAKLPENLDNLDALDVIDTIIDTYLTEQVAKVYLIAPHYHNSFTNYPVVKQFLPFSPEMLSEHMELIPEEQKRGINHSIMSYYPANPELVLNHMYRQVVSALFMQAFMELKAAEYSNRMIAMKNATDAADEMITDLTRTYNKARQGAITQEIAELIGARAAME